MTDEDQSFDTRVETNRWESFTRLTFSYFADQEYDVELDQRVGQLRITFVDADRGERALFIYEGGPPDMARESLQQMQKLFEGSTDMLKLWRNMM